MKNILFFLKKNIFIILSIFFFIISVVFVYLIFDTMGYFTTPENTYVGTISISEYDESQYSSVIASKVNSWRSDSSYTIQYQGYQYEFDLSRFDLLIDETILGITTGETNNVQFDLSESGRTEIINDLTLVFSDNIVENLDMDSLFSEIMADMGAMNILKHYRLENYLDPDLYDTIIDTVVIDSLNADDVDAIISSQEAVVIGSESRFSMLESFEIYELTNTQLSILASGFQAVTRNTPFFGYIFMQNNPLPDWAEEGMNVKILQTNDFDFSFYNALDIDYDFVITRISDTSIEVSLVGLPFVAEYEVVETDEVVIPFDTEYYDNADLDDTTPDIIIIDSAEETIYRLLIEAGVDGKIVCFTRTTTLPDSTQTTEIIYREIYYPSTEIYQENIVEK